MKQSLTIQHFFGALAVAMFMLASGCATSPPSRFFALNSITIPESTQPPAEHPSLIAVGPVTIPDYVDRPEIVTADGSNEFNVHDFDRWAGSLNSNLSSVIIEDLTASLPVGRFIVGRWDPALGLNTTKSNRVVVDVTRFDFSQGPGGTAIFAADWVLYGSDSNVLTIKKFRRTVPVHESDFKAILSTMSQCVAEFSAEIAKAIAAANGLK